jgi:multifunctional beta-oxidation protein
MGDIRYDNQVVVVTGAGNGLGKEYAKFFAERGAKVVVNDLGGTFNGKPGADAAVADVVVKEIKDAGGVAVANYNAVQEGDKIIKTAIDNFGRIDVLINNAGILRDITIRNMKDEDWDVIMDVHVTGAMKTARAAWPHFRKQCYGRIINTSSASGLFGNFGQANYAAGKMALVGFTETLAKEGAKYNIHANVLAPAAASRLTQTVWPPEMMEAMNPASVVPLVGVLVHSSCKENGGIFEAGAGHYSKIRWQRSKGFIAKPDNSLTPDVILRNFDKVSDFSQDSSYPTSVANSVDLLEQAMKQSSAMRGDQLDFKGRVALVTGGGAGLGRAYAILFARLGAKVVVNDLKGANEVAEEIRAAKGEATPQQISVEDGDAVVKNVIETYGRIDIVVNNAGILRDKVHRLRANGVVQCFANLDSPRFTGIPEHDR